MTIVIRSIDVTYYDIDHLLPYGIKCDYKKAHPSLADVIDVYVNPVGYQVKPPCNTELCIAMEAQLVRLLSRVTGWTWHLFEDMDDEVVHVNGLRLVQFHVDHNVHPIAIESDADLTTVNIYHSWVDT